MPVLTFISLCITIDNHSIVNNEDVGTMFPTMPWEHSLSPPVQVHWRRLVGEMVLNFPLQSEAVDLVLMSAFIVKSKDISSKPKVHHSAHSSVAVWILRNTYHLVRIKERDEWKTVFNTHISHCEYLVIQFGLTNVPAVFQAQVSDVLQDFNNHFVFVYLDDILIFSVFLQEHKAHVRQVLQRLIKEEKYNFHMDTV